MDDPLCKICGTRHRLGYCAKGWSAAPPKREEKITAPAHQADHSACQAEIARLTKRVAELEAEIAELAARPVLIITEPKATEPFVIDDTETVEERKKRLNREKVARHRAKKSANHGL